ncbi:hypothetical protein U9M48_032788 [Paspalum notatum var. saurae]|uniref:HAT C-terminal dimerisation domain-containing protein n=1 Tax=Paspalum notatum var. saurae TaxID=547442 RepID=A0AAQ3X5V2_PASNO
MASHHIQKDLTKACAEEVMTVIMDEIHGRKFSVLIDESRDVSKKDKMAMILRFVSDEGKVLESHKLSISMLRGQGYDEAYNMRGEFNVVVTVSTSTPAIADFFNYVPLIVNNVGASCMRKDALLAKHHDILLEKVENVNLEASLDVLEETNNFLDKEINARGISYPLVYRLIELTLIEDKRTGMHRSYPLVYRLIELTLILPVATASIERVYSAMSIIKTDLRNKMGDEWLNDLMICYTEKEIFRSISNEKIMKRFEEMKERRMLIPEKIVSGVLTYSAPLNIFPTSATASKGRGPASSRRTRPRPSRGGPTPASATDGDCVVMYNPREFQLAGIKAKTNSLGFSMAVDAHKTFFIPISALLLDHIGRGSCCCWPAAAAAQAGSAVAEAAASPPLRR